MSWSKGQYHSMYYLLKKIKRMLVAVSGSRTPDQDTDIGIARWRLFFGLFLLVYLNPPSMRMRMSGWQKGELE